MRGVSGAHVSVHQDTAVKVAPEGPARERLHAQYEWLMRHCHVPLVRVRRWECNGYNMERLGEFPVEDRAIRLVSGAERLWSFGAEVELDVNEHVKWAAERTLHLHYACRATTWVRINHLIPQVEYVMEHHNALRRVLTHGDLTRSNVMTRSRSNPSRIPGESSITSGEPALIDPIPATPACADIWAFDVATVVISLLGLEHVVYGWPAPNDEDRRWITSLLMRCNPVELECVRYMGAVEIGRRIPYFPKETWSGLIDIARQAVRIRP